jgi:NUMOD3 motif
MTFLPGHKVSPETRAKISAAKKGKKRPPEVVARIVASNTGKKRTKAQKARYRAGALKMHERHEAAANTTPLCLSL